MAKKLAEMQNADSKEFGITKDKSTVPLALSRLLRNDLGLAFCLATVVIRYMNSKKEAERPTTVTGMALVRILQHVPGAEVSQNDQEIYLLLPISAQ